MVAPALVAKLELKSGASLPGPVSRAPLSKTEINLHRLLKSCERQAAELEDACLSQDPRFANYVAVSRDLLNELQGRGVANALPSISAPKAQQYEERIAKLEKRVDQQTREATPALLEPASDTSGPDSQQPTTAGDGAENARVSERASTANTQAEPELRRRVGSRHVAARDATTAQPQRSGGKLDDDVSRVLDQHRQLQEGLTDEMVGLARAIKMNSLAMEQSMQETGKVLDATERAVEHSVATVGHVNTRAASIYSKTFRTGCFTWLVLLAVSVIFFGMVFLIRIT